MKNSSNQSPGRFKKILYRFLAGYILIMGLYYGIIMVHMVYTTLINPGCERYEGLFFLEQWVVLYVIVPLSLIYIIFSLLIFRNFLKLRERAWAYILIISPLYFWTALDGHPISYFCYDILGLDIQGVTGRDMSEPVPFLNQLLYYIETIYMAPLTAVSVYKAVLFSYKKVKEKIKR